MKQGAKTKAEALLPKPAWPRRVAYVLGPLLCYLVGTAVVEGLLLTAGLTALVLTQGSALEAAGLAGVTAGAGAQAAAGWETLSVVVSFALNNTYWLLALGSAVLLYPFFLRRYYRDWSQRVRRKADGSFQFCLRESGRAGHGRFSSWLQLWRQLSSPLCAVIFAASAALFGNLLLNFLARSWTFLLSGVAQQNEAILQTNLTVVFVATVLLVPLFEELVFRGLFYRRLRDYCGVRFASVFSALCFGLLHETLGQAALGFMMGLLFAWIYERSQSLAEASLAHASANAVNFVLLAMSKQAALRGTLSFSPLMLVCLLALSAYFAAMMYRQFLKKPAAPAYYLYSPSLSQGELNQ